MVHIKASKKQLSKLRNGHKVRIAPAIEGEGFNLIIHPERYNIVSRAFNKGKGTEIQLSPEEIVVNQEEAPNMEGSGIFGKKFDNMVERTIGKKAKDTIYKGADKYLKPKLKQGIDVLADYAPHLGATALAGLATASGNPEFAPQAGLVGYNLGSMVGNKGRLIGKDYLDRPSVYQGSSNAGGPRNRIAPSTLAGQVQQNELLNNLNQDLGTKFGALSKANLSNAVAHMDRAGMNNASINQQLGRFRKPENAEVMAGTGLYAGRGHRERGSVGRGASMVGHQTHLPPALTSQPFSANFQFQHTLPPAYQKFSKGGGLYA